MKTHKFDMPYIGQLSINHCYGQRIVNGRIVRFMNKNPSRWKDALKRLVWKWATENNIVVTSGKQVEIFLDARFPTVVGGKPDADNFHKLAKDAITAGLGLKSDHEIKISDASISHNCEKGRLIYEVRINEETEVPTPLPQPKRKRPGSRRKIQNDTPGGQPAGD